MSETPQTNQVEKVAFNEVLNKDNPIENQTDEKKPEHKPEAANSLNNKLNLLLDIEVTLTIEMGSKNIKLKDLLKLGKNSVIELDRLAGDPLDIKVNGSLIARGEVVIVNEHYGIVSILFGNG